MFYRKALLPIEAQIHSTDDVDIVEPSIDFDIGIEDVVHRMNEIRKKMFDKASDNIKQAQARYKESYDKKRENQQV